MNSECFPECSLSDRRNPWCSYIKMYAGSSWKFLKLGLQYGVILKVLFLRIAKN
jgi:hypothetical protein